jgi:hypothetical protein
MLLGTPNNIPIRLGYRNEGRHPPNFLEIWVFEKKEALLKQIIPKIPQLFPQSVFPNGRIEGCSTVVMGSKGDPKTPKDFQP